MVFFSFISMKIALVTNFLPDTHNIWGGAEKAAEHILLLLENKGESVSAMTTTPVKRKVSVVTTKTLEDVIGKKPAEYIKYWFPFDIVSYFSMKHNLKVLKPDVIHIQNFNVLSLSVISAAKSLGIPVVLSVYDYWVFCPKITLILKNGSLCHKFHGKWCYDCLEIKRFGILQNIASRFRNVFFNHFLKQIDRFIVLSNASGRIISEYGIKKNKIRVVHLPLIDNTKNGSVDIEKNSIFFGGWIQPNKGVHVLLEAFALVIKKIPSAKLYLLGMEANESYSAKINGIIEKYHLSKNILRFGRVDRKDFYRMMEQANVVVIPEQWENMSPVILLESMSRGKAVVASDLGGIPEFVSEGKTGFLAKYDSPKSFAAKIVKILSDPELASMMGNNAKLAFKKVFNEDSIYSGLREVYDEVTTKKRR